MRKFLVVAIPALALLSPARAAEQAVPRKPLDPALAKMAGMVGGVWSNDDPKFRVEFRYDWAFNQTAVRGIGITDKGGPNETVVESTFGWDPGKKTAYDLDQHGSERFYKGTLHVDGDRLVLEFATLIGPPASWRSVSRFPDKDTYQFTIYGRKDGKWTPVVKQTLKRKERPADESRQITEDVIDAPLDDSLFSQVVPADYKLTTQTLELPKLGTTVACAPVPYRSLGHRQGNPAPGGDTQALAAALAAPALGRSTFARCASGAAAS